MGPQLPVPFDRLVLICLARVICFTFSKHWVQEYTVNLSGFCQSYMLDSMHDGVLVSPSKGGFIWLHSSEDFATIRLWARVVCFIIKLHLWNLLNYGNNRNQPRLRQTASHHAWNPLHNFGKKTYKVRVYSWIQWQCLQKCEAYHPCRTNQNKPINRHG